MFLLKDKRKYIILTLFLLSCVVEEKEAKLVTYDFDSLIAGQVKYLSHHHAKLIKKASIDNKKDNLEFVPDSTEWIKELSIFKEINAINNPRSKNLYDIQDGQRDSKSNLTICEYRATQKTSLPFLKIFYQGEPQHIKKVEARYYEENALFSSTRYMTLQFSNIEDQLVLTAYSVEGNQKMMFSDSVKYRVTAVITQP